MISCVDSPIPELRLQASSAVGLFVDCGVPDIQHQSLQIIQATLEQLHLNPDVILKEWVLTLPKPAKLSETAAKNLAAALRLEAARPDKRVCRDLRDNFGLSNIQRVFY